MPRPRELPKTHILTANVLETQARALRETREGASIIKVTRFSNALSLRMSPLCNERILHVSHSRDLALECDMPIYREIALE